MISWFQNFIISLVILGIALILILPPEKVQADTVTVLIQVMSVCGDSVIEGDEQCEGIDLNGQTCQSIGYQSGDLACLGNCTFDTSGCVPFPSVTSPGGGGSHGYTPPLSAKVILRGRAYPDATLNILKYGQVIAISKVDSFGFFKEEIADIFEGTYIFGILAEDREGRKSVVVTFPISVLWGMTAVIDNIFIPPTISLSPIQAEKGEEIDISGEAFPGSDIQLFISPQNLIKETKTNSQGQWTYKLDTALLEEESYQVKAKAFFDEREETSFSQPFSFYIGPYVPLPLEPLPPAVCQGADLNFDDKVNLVDFSILLFWWGQEKIDYPYIDINRDGKIDIIDFSIMMYWWTG